VSASLQPGSFGRDEQDWFGGRDDEAEAAASKSLAATAARMVGAKPFPVAAKRLEELTRTTNARIEQVVVVLESDPALSVRLLRLVNSAGYGLKVRCTSVRHAAVLVGTRRLNQVATTAAILDRDRPHDLADVVEEAAREQAPPEPAVVTPAPVSIASETAPVAVPVTDARPAIVTTEPAPPAVITEPSPPLAAIGQASDMAHPDEGSGVRHVLVRNEPGVLREGCSPVVLNRCS
jgi:hypothetical protein